MIAKVALKTADQGKNMKNDDHLQWIKNLKVGDLVCDCNYNHVPIIELHKELSLKPFWLKLMGILPSFVWNITWMFLLDDFLHHNKWTTNFYDYTLVLKGGAVCSARHCCHPVPHEWDHEDFN